MEIVWSYRKDGGEEAIVGPARLSVSPEPENKPLLEVQTDHLGYVDVMTWSDGVPRIRGLAKAEAEAALRDWAKAFRGGQG